MRSKFDASYIGLIIGIIVPILSLYMLSEYYYNTLNFFEFLERMEYRDSIPKMISLSVIPNLLVFYIFIWKKFYYAARGVIGSTFLYVIVVVILKYLV